MDGDYYGIRKKRNVATMMGIGTCSPSKFFHHNVMMISVTLGHTVFLSLAVSKNGDVLAKLVSSEYTEYLSRSLALKMFCLFRHVIEHLELNNSTTLDHLL